MLIFSKVLVGKGSPQIEEDVKRIMMTVIKRISIGGRPLSSLII